MRPVSSRIFGSTSVLLLAGFVAALLVRLASLDARQVWIDEAFTQFALSLDWRDLIADRLSAGHSPLYFVLLKALGFDPASILPLRAASAVMDAAACTIFGATVLRIKGRRAAALGMALYALSPLLLVWSQNARPYAMMMLALAIGIHGAAAVIGAAQRYGGNRRESVVMALGLTLAALTLTAGAIAVLLVILVPLAVSPLRQEPEGWLKASILPLVGVAAMASAVSLPAAVLQSGTYWTDRAAPFSLGVLADLARALIVGDRFRPDELPLVLGTVPGWWATILGGLLFGWGAFRGLRDLRRTPALLPFASLAVAYPLVLIVLSTSTSLLIPRYFLPALGPALMLAGAGLATVRGRAGAWLAAGTLLAASLLALNQSLVQGPQHRPDLIRAADLILAGREPGTTLFRAPDDGVGFDLMAILLPRALGPDPNPKVTAASPTDLARALTERRPAWLVTRTETWNAYKALVPAPDCLLADGGTTLAYWGRHPPRNCP